MAFAVILVPYSLIGPFAGVLLDRWSRQRVLITANLLRALLCLAVVGLVASGRDDASFLAMALAVIGVNRFVLSGLSAALPHVVERATLVTANAVSTTMGTLATVAGVALGIGVRLLAGGEDSGVGVVVATAACLYALSGALAGSLLQRNQLGPDLADAAPATREAVRSVVHGFVQGLDHLRRRRRAAAAIGALGAFRVGWGLVTVGGVLLFRTTYNAPSDPDAGLQSLGFAFALGGVGVFAAALVTPWLSRRYGIGRLVVSALLIAAVSEALLGPRFTESTLLATALLVTATGQTLKICADTVVQSEVDDAYRGRVFSVYDLVFNVTFVLGGLVAAVVLPPDGRSLTVVWVAVACWLTGAVAYSRAVHQSRNAASASSGGSGPRSRRRSKRNR